jgi:hypothetical protein
MDIRRFLMTATLAATVGAVALATLPTLARADGDDHGREHAWRGHEWREHDWHEHHEWAERRWEAPPPVYYAPPPTYYVPPAVVYRAPGW